MMDAALSIIAPHHCSGCNILGTLLCDNCKYDIISEPFSACGTCGRGVARKNGLCGKCKVSYVRIWCVSDRRDQLERLIDSYKFTNARDAYRPLADLLHQHLPELPQNTVIVPVPTVGSHIRQRGYDHILLIAQRLGSLRKLPIDTSLRRITTTKQRSASAKQRLINAKAAFACTRALDPEVTYLLIDDVVTTGATVEYATRALLNAGAMTVWVASVSRQPVD